MIFLLMSLLPCAIAAGCFVLRPNTRLGLYAGLATLAVELIFLLQLPVNIPARSLGVELAADVSGQVLIGALLLAVSSAYVGWSALPVGRYALPGMLVILGLSIGALLLQPIVPALLLLLIAVAISTALIVDTSSEKNVLLAPRALATALIRLVLLLLGALLMVMGYLLLPPSLDVSFGTLLMWLGLLVWAGLMPFHFTLAHLAEDTTPHVFLCVVVVQALVLALFQRIVGAHPASVSELPHTLLLVVAGTTAIGAPLLARGTVRRAMAFVLLANVGQVVLALVLGMVGSSVLPLLAAHVLAATLICSSIALLDAHVAGRSDTGEPWRERPIAAAGLAVGLLMLLGVPGLGGFAPKLALWQTAWRDGPLAIGIVAVGTLLLIVAAAQVARAMLFTSTEQRDAERRQHWRQRITPGNAPESDVTTLPVTPTAYVPAPLRYWTLALIAVAVASAIDTLFPS